VLSTKRYSQVKKNVLIYSKTGRAQLRLHYNV